MFGALRDGFARRQEPALFQHEAAQFQQVLGLPRQQLQPFDLGGGQSRGTMSATLTVPSA